MLDSNRFESLQNHEATSEERGKDKRALGIRLAWHYLNYSRRLPASCFTSSISWAASPNQPNVGGNSYSRISTAKRVEDRYSSLFAT